MKRIDLTSQRFGRLVVAEKSHTDSNKKVVWKCVCECGNIAFVRTHDLITGHTQSCGCFQREMTSKASKRHGMRHTKIYHTWLDMKDRCFNERNKRFFDWGGRGITVCDEWKNSFQAFYDHVSQLPHFGEEGYSIDRINNDENYEPGNVRWATVKEQNNNKRKAYKNGIKS